jgi:hypothetical protein
LFKVIFYKKAFELTANPTPPKPKPKPKVTDFKAELKIKNLLVQKVFKV